MVPVGAVAANADPHNSPNALKPTTTFVSVFMDSSQRYLLTGPEYLGVESASASDSDSAVAPDEGMSDDGSALSGVFVMSGDAEAGAEEGIDGLVSTGAGTLEASDQPQSFRTCWNALPFKGILNSLITAPAVSIRSIIELGFIDQ